MGFLDRFTSIDDLLVTLLERIGGTTEEDTHFFSFPNDGSRATLAKGKTTIDYMAGTVMSPAGTVTDLGNSLRARGREYCRSLSLQADQDIIIQIGNKSKIPISAGTWFKVSHLRFVVVNIIASQTTHVFAIACTNPDSIDMAGETYVKDPVDKWGKTATIGNGELAARLHAPPMTFDKRGSVVRWLDFDSATPNYELEQIHTTISRTMECCDSGDFALKVTTQTGGFCRVTGETNDFHNSRVGCQMVFSSTDKESSLIALRMEVYDGGYVKEGMIYIENDTGDVYIDNSPNPILLGNISFSRSKYNFSTIKLVVDLATGKYVRCAVMGEEFDISAYDLVVTGNTDDPVFKFGSTILTSGAAGTYYIDSIILTENEPL